MLRLSKKALSVVLLASFICILMSRMAYATEYEEYVKYGPIITVSRANHMSGYYIYADEIWKGSKITKVTISNKKVIPSAESFEYGSDNGLYFSTGKKGTATLIIALRKGKKTKKVTTIINVVNYSVPYSSITLGGKKVKFVTSSEGRYAEIKSSDKEMKIVVNPKKGWKLKIYTKDYNETTDKITYKYYSNKTKLLVDDDIVYHIMLYNDKLNLTETFNLFMYK